MLAVRHIAACVPMFAAAACEGFDSKAACDRDNGHSSAAAGNRTKAYTDEKAGAPLRAEVIFLGSGSSTGSPAAWCLMDRHASDPRCVVSKLAAQGDPKDNKNYRCNPSLLLRVHHKDGPKCILFDAGKTFRESIIRWLPEHQIQSVDACVLTHGHADAILGLDDMRGLQAPPAQVGTPIYLSQETLEVVVRTFSYLFPAQQPGFIQRHIAKLDFHVIEPWQQLSVAGVPMVPIPVKHGEDMVNLGFIIGENKKCCYISDVSRIPEKTMQYLLSLDLDLLIIDTLFKHLRHSTHFSQDEVIGLCKTLKPKRTYLLGLSSEFEHDKDNEALRKLQNEIGVDIQLSHDGLKLDVVL